MASTAVRALEVDPYHALDGLTKDELKRIVVSYQTRQPLGLHWERDLIAADKALNADNVVLDMIREDASHLLTVGDGPWENLVIEGDNFDALRLLKRTHAGKVRVIFIDPPYNTGEKDWVYNDRFVVKDDRFRFSQWLEFLYQRLSIAKDLLTDDGVVLVTINDDNRAVLELLLDQVFEGMRIGSFVWRSRDSTSAAKRNFSDVHEHVLVYGKAGFSFIGSSKSEKKYSNKDNDPRGIWNGDPLTLGFDRFERPNLFYPLHNPVTDTWYPCDQTRVWAYATESRVEDTESLQAETMESFISKNLIIFPAKEETRVWDTLDALMADVKSGDVPVTPKRKRPLITEDLPELDFWVGKKVGFGRPLFKKLWSALRSHENPVGSWIARQKEQDEDDEVLIIRS
ncbi:MAG: site-specific DNA-methyltransferase, partial [Candidatus Dormibacteria bacterium]